MPRKIIETRLLQHVSCAPSAAWSVQRLLEAGRRVTLYYSNSNIATADEFERRLESVRALAGIFDLPLEIDRYDPPAWQACAACLAAEPERGARCPVCFHFSLERTARRAAALGANFATTLTVSPHKSSRVIFEVGARWNHFEPHDFKKKNGFCTPYRLCLTEIQKY